MSKKSVESEFRFAISLSVLNHLGRNLYRNFITVLGEAISNAWDADAKCVWIEINRDEDTFNIKDDGVGMSAQDFQEKFLKIGYSKRSGGASASARNRPFIGAKGIGKLALLSCADRVSVFTKEKDGEYVGGLIDNSELDTAITSDLLPDEYPLEELDFSLIDDLSKDHDEGTIVVFEGLRHLRNSVDHLRKLIALSFRFSLIDEEFSIFVNGDEVTDADLSDLMAATEFLWLINDHSDDFTSGLEDLKSSAKDLKTSLAIAGYIASVEKPRDLKVAGTDERVTIDLFVNGRLREKNILRHIPTQRIVESYIYGQIHFNAMDRPGVDPFTSSREGVVEDDENFVALLDYLKRDALSKIFDEWDKLRLGRGQEGDDENPRKTKKERKARDLYNAAKAEYEPDGDAPKKDLVDGWLDALMGDAEFNLSAYADCFLSENLIRKFIHEKGMELVKSAPNEIETWRQREADRKGEANISFQLRKNDDDLSYLGMDMLAETAEGSKSTGGNPSLWSDAISYKPVRNVVGHTGLLTDNAKSHLTLTHENIKARVKSLVSEKENKSK